MFWIASPRPMLSTIFSSRGTAMRFVDAELLHQLRHHLVLDSVLAAAARSPSASALFARCPWRLLVLRLRHLVFVFA